MNSLCSILAYTIRRSELMSYIKAADVLPREIIDKIQHYVDGEYIYIPRKESNRKTWGENTRSKEFVLRRNEEIYKNYIEGMSARELAGVYFLSQKSVQKIIARQRWEDLSAGENKGGG
ncbi:hypothetical protein JFL75_05940 [Breznakiella homolactica]|uniref:Mor transcription activator domain-containing protein n=2 Tax=Breznakiella homolactica TaxID=2798577 RepID=A0A7T7XRX1_9SPIR|nr:CD3324 family protein [Breznakiella homolactica]QQO11332.1 hypothetical protein JFL75_05940 [Breznakiella homolactica]